MADERLGISLQQNIITILCHDSVNGKIVANLVDPNLFEGDYRLVAERAIDYWRKFGSAPKLHTADLLSDILEDPDNRRAPSFKRILISMLELAESINSTYVIDQLRTFTRLQRVKSAILKSAEQINAHSEIALDEVEGIWNNMLRVQDDTFDAGLKLTDIDRMMNYLEYQQSEFTTGINELDKNHVVPMRGTTMLILAGSGLGKTWMLIQMGKQALLQRKKVLHITLEMSEEQVAQRYYQSIFSVSKREKKVDISTLDINSMGNLVGVEREEVSPDFTLERLDLARDELETRITLTGQKLNRLIIKRFSGLTIDGLRAYLDNLETVLNFVPDMVILDYLGLLKISSKDYRLALGAEYKRFRDLMIERNMAGVTAQQGSKEGTRSIKMDSTHVAEDWSLIGTSDIVITYSQTAKEKLYDLARLFVGKARDEVDKFTVLITQSYTMGQFALESAYLTSKYTKLLKDLPGDDDDNEKEYDDEDEYDE